MHCYGELFTHVHETSTRLINRSYYLLSCLNRSTDKTPSRRRRPCSNRRIKEWRDIQRNACRGGRLYELSDERRYANYMSCIVQPDYCPCSKIKSKQDVHFLTNDLLILIPNTKLT
jgi:hypothetical protein